MSVQQYLERHAEDESRLSQSISQTWRHVLCVPAMDETEYLPQLLTQLEESDHVLLILVLNTPEGVADSLVTATRQLASALKRRYPLQQAMTEEAALLALGRHQSHLLLLERYGLPASEAVGLARKIACDIACQLISDGKVRSRWIHNTDADVTLPADYFSVQPDTDVAAALYPFRHAANTDAHKQACLSLYEFSLHYYVAGLAWAGSPYAFHTIGSTLLINHEHYALARGFPRRAAGEDFYLLNKLAKTGAVVALQTLVLTLSGRESDRVPFGTGPAISRISALPSAQDEYLYYHPQCFLYLRLWLRVMPGLMHAELSDSLAGRGILLDSLQELGVDAALDHARQHSLTRPVFERHMHNWFDGFRTLKLIHALRDRGLESVNRETVEAYGKKYRFIGRAAQSFAGSNTKTS